MVDFDRIVQAVLAFVKAIIAESEAVQEPREHQPFAMTFDGPCSTKGGWIPVAEPDRIDYFTDQMYGDPFEHWPDEKQ